MKQLPILLALLAIGASGFAIPPKDVPHRTQAIPMVEPISVSIDELALPIHTRKAFKESEIPKSISALHGKRVRMIGSMYPTWEETGVKEFVFNGDTKRKFYNVNADIALIPVEYYIFVKMREGTTTSYTQRPIEIEGRLIVEPIYVEDELNSLYRIEDATIHSGTRQSGFKQSVGIGC